MILKNMLDYNGLQIYFSDEIFQNFVTGKELNKD